MEDVVNEIPESMRDLTVAALLRRADAALNTVLGTNGPEAVDVTYVIHMPEGRPA